MVRTHIRGLTGIGKLRSKRERLKKQIKKIDKILKTLDKISPER